MQSLRFWKTNFHDPFGSFLNELRDKAALCNFKDIHRMIRDKLVFSVCDKLQQILLHEENLTFKKTVQICQPFEMANRNATELQSFEHTGKQNRVYLTIMSIYK